MITSFSTHSHNSGSDVLIIANQLIHFTFLSHFAAMAVKWDKTSAWHILQVSFSNVYVVCPLSHAAHINCRGPRHFFPSLMNVWRLHSSCSHSGQVQKCWWFSGILVWQNVEVFTGHDSLQVNFFASVSSHGKKLTGITFIMALVGAQNWKNNIIYKNQTQPPDTWNCNHLHKLKYKKWYSET